MNLKRSHDIDCNFTSEMIYMSNDLWEEMVNKEKEKFKEIELYYARLLEKKNVSKRI